MDHAMVDRVREAVARLAATEQGDVVRLTDVWPPTFRLRVGDWRVLFMFDVPAAAIRVLRGCSRGARHTVEQVRRRDSRRLSLRPEQLTGCTDGSHAR